MSIASSIDFALFQPVNYLWPQFVEKLGTHRAQQAIRQAIDLQLIYGTVDTMPVLLVETCGVALAKINLIRQETGFNCYGSKMVLILSTKNKVIQLLLDT